MDEIPNESLTPDLVPPAGCGWDAVSRFALTLNGYRVRPGLEPYPPVAELLRAGTLTELRGWLFFRQRLQHHVGHEPDEDTLAEAYRVLVRIRDKVAAGETD